MSFLSRSKYMLFVLAALCSSVFGHTYLSAVYLNNKLLNEGDCVRPHPSTAFDSPIPLVNSPDMTCGWLPTANNAANRKCPTAAGSTIGIQWHHNSNSPSDDIIEYTHKGPVMVYLAKSDSGSGNVWFKIYEDGFVDGRWGVDRLKDRNGRVDVTIPSDLAPGNYLLRGEVIALHSAYDVNGVQPYVGCVELTISGSGSASPSGVALPGYYKNTDPGMLINIYQTVTSYVIPGPAVYKSGSSSSSSGSSSSGSSSATSAPTSAPPTAPTTRPTTSPTTAPTSAPVDGSSIKAQVNGGSNVWWFAVDFTGGNEETVKVELSDSGSVKNYYIMSKAPYGYYFSQSVQLQLPISIRLTSASGKQVELKNYFTSFNNGGVVDTGKKYGSSSTSAPTTKPTSAPVVTAAPTRSPVVTSAPVTSAPVTSAPVTSAPVTSAPVTSAPVTSAPVTDAPSTGSKVTFKQNPGSSAWWFAVAVSGIDADKIHGVELKDSDSIADFACLEATNWGYYTFATAGTPLAAPVTLRITTVDGDQAIATFSSFSGNSEASGRF